LHNTFWKEAEDDDILLLSLTRKKRRAIRKMFAQRKLEGCFNTPIRKHLIDDFIKH